MIQGIKLPPWVPNFANVKFHFRFELSVVRYAAGGTSTVNASTNGDTNLLIAGIVVDKTLHLGVVAHNSVGQRQHEQDGYSRTWRSVTRVLQSPRIDNYQLYRAINYHRELELIRQAMEHE